MINAYLTNTEPPKIVTPDNIEQLHDAVWIDLINPTKEEEKLVEKTLALDIPTRKEMREIELSSRLYKEDGSLFMTVTMIAKADSPHPKSDAVTLILTATKLITIRYIEPSAFTLFIARLKKIPLENFHATNLLVELLEVSVDRLADILEDVSHRLDDFSKLVFRPQLHHKDEKPNYKHHFQSIGANGELGTKVQESLITFNRLITFFQQDSSSKINAEIQEKLTTLSKDIRSLSDYVSFLSNKVNFLLDATLGMVNIEQNNVIKIFSILAVILLPPTLVASIYGMNFHHMPELSWQWGYPLSILLMIISGLLPYSYFKKKKWL